MAECWECHMKTANPDFCSNCGKIQPMLEDIDYFELLGFKETLNIEPDKLEGKYYELSKKFHPDYYQNGSKEEKEISLEKSSYLNKAYNTIKNPFDRAKYMLNLMWDEKREEDSKAMPPEILMEVMELHETVDSMKHETDPEARKERENEVIRIKNEMKRRIAGLSVELLNLFSKWDNKAEHWNSKKLLCFEHKNLLKEMNKILTIRQYLKNILINIEEELSAETM